MKYYDNVKIGELWKHKNTGMTCLIVSFLKTAWGVEIVILVLKTDGFGLFHSRSPTQWHSFSFLAEWEKL